VDGRRNSPLESKPRDDILSSVEERVPGLPKARLLVVFRILGF
jgi:hypothetical protein